HDFRIVHLTLAVFLMMHGFQHIVTEAERRDNFVVHGLLSLGDEMAVSSLIWGKKLMDSISGNLGYNTISPITTIAAAPWTAADLISTAVSPIPCCDITFRLLMTAMAISSHNFRMRLRLPAT